jgi:hypothetical protein
MTKVLLAPAQVNAIRGYLRKIDLILATRMTQGVDSPAIPPQHRNDGVTSDFVKYDEFRSLFEWGELSILYDHSSREQKAGRGNIVVKQTDVQNKFKNEGVVPRAIYEYAQSVLPQIRAQKLVRRSRIDWTSEKDRVMICLMMTYPGKPYDTVAEIMSKRFSTFVTTNAVKGRLENILPKESVHNLRKTGLTQDQIAYVKNIKRRSR